MNPRRKAQRYSPNEVKRETPSFHRIGDREIFKLVPTLFFLHMEDFPPLTWHIL